MTYVDNPKNEILYALGGMSLVLGPIILLSYLENTSYGKLIPDSEGKLILLIIFFIEFFTLGTMLIFYSKDNFF